MLRIGPAFTVALLIYHATGIVPLREWVRASRGEEAVNFFSGAVAATLCQMEHPNHPRQRDAWAGMGAALLIVAIVVASKANLIGTGRTWLIDKHYVFGPLWSVVIYATYRRSASATKLSLLRSIGNWSYSIYLFHWLVAVAAATALPAAFAFPCRWGDQFWPAPLAGVS